MIELKKYPIEEAVLEQLPPYYHFMTYNNLLCKDFEERFGSFSERYNGNFIIRPSEKAITQVIDFMPLDQIIQDELFK